MTSPNAETLEQLLAVIVENREKRCAEIGKSAHQQADSILKQAHSRVRSRLHRHISILREKYRTSLLAAQARSQTSIRQQHQKADSVFLDSAWPALHEALLSSWNEPASRRKWIEAAIANASSTLLQRDWHVEYPRDFTAEARQQLKRAFDDRREATAGFSASDDIEAGIRIITHGTVLDATLAGLLQRRTAIEATLIARLNQQGSRELPRDQKSTLENS